MGVYDLSEPELVERLASWGEPAFRGRQVHRQLWRRAATYDEMSDVSPTLRERLARELPIEVRAVAERTADRGATRKALLELGPRRHLVEAVLMGYRDRVTVCVSTQVGCAMGCGFCATGQMGLAGNLKAGEIAAQVLWAARTARELPSSTPRRLTNVVYMGMGEPLANERGTFGSLERLLAPEGVGIGARHVTVSTVGLVPGIRRLAERFPQVGLAVSFHAATDELRERLVPIDRVHPIASLVEAMREHRVRTRRRPSIEWAMIRDENDTQEQARALVPIARATAAHVNLIPLNPTPGWPSEPSPPQRIRRFAAILEGARVPVTVRDTRGRRIDAACGQLRVDVTHGAATG